MIEGAKRCFQFLQQLGLKVSVFVSDRHRGIAKWIRQVCKETTHYYDIWHVAHSVTKKLLAASKEKGCEIIKEWSKGIRWHLYWSATSTKLGFSNLILAKWKSFLRHVANKHANHPDPVYHKCNHEELPPRKWIKVAPYSFLSARELVSKSRDGASFKKSTRKSRATSTTASNSHWSNFSNHHCSFPMC